MLTDEHSFNLLNIHSTFTLQKAKAEEEARKATELRQKIAEEEARLAAEAAKKSKKKKKGKKKK